MLARTTCNAGAGIAAIIIVLLCSDTKVNAQSYAQIREARLARLQELNARGERDFAVTHAVLGTSWPAEMRAEVTDALNTVIEAQAPDERLSASAVRSFVALNDFVPSSLIPYLRRALANAEGGDKYELLAQFALLALRRRIYNQSYERR